MSKAQGKYSHHQMVKYFSGCQQNSSSAILLSSSFIEITRTKIFVHGGRVKQFCLSKTVEHYRGDEKL